MTTLSEAFSIGLRHHEAGRLQEAEAVYREILRAVPDQPNALHLLGVLATQAGRQQLAIEQISRAIEQVPEAPEFHDSLAAAYLADGSLEEAIASGRRAVELNPDFAEAYNNLGTALQRIGKPAEAIEAFQRAIAIRSGFAAAHYNLAISLKEQGQSAEAEAAYRTAIELRPDYPAARNNLGNLLRELGRLDEAADAFRGVLQIDPYHARALSNLGLVFQDQGALDEAADSFHKALELRWDYVEAHHNLGNALKAQELYAEAESSYRQALLLDNRFAEAYNNLGITLREQGRFDEAVDCYQRAIEVRDDYGEAYHNLGNLFRSQGALDEAAAVYRQAQQAHPHQPLWALRIATLCPTIFQSTQAIAEHRSRLQADIERFTAMDLKLELDELTWLGSEPPFNLQFDDGNLRPLKEAYAGIFRHAFESWSDVPPAGSGGSRTRIGVVVTNGHERLFLRSLGQVIRRLDKSKFDLVIVCSPAGAGRLKEPAAEASARLLPTAEPLGRIARTIRDARFDVLYYFEIGTDATNYFLPFLRLAPVQCTSWGIQVTSGIPQIDYYLSSALVEPEGAEDHYSEKLLLADTLLTCRQRESLTGSPRTREDFCFAPDDHVYLCAHQLGKFHPDFDRLLGEILRRDPNGRVVITEDISGYGARLLKQRLCEGLPDVAAKIDFWPRLGRDEYLALTAAADVLLDPIHFGGVNTTYDGFSLNKPIVTRPSGYHRGRYTMGCYRKMGLDQYVATSDEAYVDMAVRLATDATYRHDVEAAIAEGSQALFEDQKAVDEHERLFDILAHQARHKAA